MRLDRLAKILECRRLLIASVVPVTRRFTTLDLKLIEARICLSRSSLNTELNEFKCLRSTNQEVGRKTKQNKH